MNLGILAIWIAVGAAVASTITSVLAGKGAAKVRENQPARPIASLASTAYMVLLGAYSLAGVFLMSLFFSHDFAFKYVAEFSSRTQSTLYLVSAFWAGQEG